MTEIKPWKERCFTKHVFDKDTTLLMQIGAMCQEIDELRAALAKVEQGEPVARVTGYHAGRCVIEPLDRATVFPAGMAVYFAIEDLADLTPEYQNAVQAAHDGLVQTAG